MDFFYRSRALCVVCPTNETSAQGGISLLDTRTLIYHFIKSAGCNPRGSVPLSDETISESRLLCCVVYLGIVRQIVEV